MNRKPFRKAGLAGWVLLAAWLNAGLPLAQAQSYAPAQRSYPGMSVRQTVSTGLVTTHLDASLSNRVKVAWLSDPLTFSLNLDLKSTPTGLRVVGYVPNASIKQRALVICQQITGEPVEDGLRVLPSLSPRQVITVRAKDLEQYVLRYLANEFPEAMESVSVAANRQGQVTVSGIVNSHDDELEICQTLRKIPYCRNVVSQIQVNSTTVTMNRTPRPQPVAGYTTTTVHESIPTAQGGYTPRSTITEYRPNSQSTQMDRVPTTRPDLPESPEEIPGVLPKKTEPVESTLPIPQIPEPTNPESKLPGLNELPEPTGTSQPTPPVKAIPDPAPPAVTSLHAAKKMQLPEIPAVNSDSKGDSELPAMIPEDPVVAPSSQQNTELPTLPSDVDSKEPLPPGTTDVELPIPPAPVSPKTTPSKLSKLDAEKDGSSKWEAVRIDTNGKTADSKGKTPEPEWTKIEVAQPMPPELAKREGEIKTDASVKLTSHEEKKSTAKNAVAYESVAVVSWLPAKQSNTTPAPSTVTKVQPTSNVVVPAQPVSQETPPEAIGSPANPRLVQLVAQACGNAATKVVVRMKGDGSLFVYLEVPSEAVGAQLFQNINAIPELGPLAVDFRAKVAR